VKTIASAATTHIRTAKRALNLLPRLSAIRTSAQKAPTANTRLSPQPGQERYRRWRWTRDQLIPDLMRSFLDSKPCLIRSPSAIRPWQFVLEPLRGYLRLAERLEEDRSAVGSAWNFGPAEGDAKAGLLDRETGS